MGNHHTNNEFVDTLNRLNNEAAHVIKEGRRIRQNSQNLRVISQIRQNLLTEQIFNASLERKAHKRL